MSISNGMRSFSLKMSKTDDLWAISSNISPNWQLDDGQLEIDCALSQAQAFSPATIEWPFTYSRSLFPLSLHFSKKKKKKKQLTISETNV